MAKCRLQNIIPACGYTVEGISEIKLLDFEDFIAFEFDGDNLYDSCLVTGIVRTNDFTQIEAPDLVAKYTGPVNNGVYAHGLETFVNELSAQTISNLHLATKRRQLVLFKTNAGKYFIFGYEAGAIVTYTGQTAEAIGSLVTIQGASIYPLFEVIGTAVTNFVRPSEFDIDFNNGAYCEIT